MVNSFGEIMRKNLIILLLATLPISSFANLFNKDATNDETRNSIIESLVASELTCSDQVDGTSYKTSMLNLAVVFEENYNLIVSETLPVITLEKLELGKYSKKKWIMKTTVDAETNKVIELELKSYHYVTTTKVNVGTTSSPEYIEEINLGNPSEEILCK